MTLKTNSTFYSEHLDKIISDKKFLDMEGYNEVPFFICPFPPKITPEIDEIVRGLINKLTVKGMKICEINLYDLSISILQQRNMLDVVIDNEIGMDKDELKEALQSMLNIPQNLLPEIEKLINSENYQLILITGVGEVFNYIRSHNILNNLQDIVKNIPMVMFFPGEYVKNDNEGSSLNLFSLLPADNYYRAFDITEYNL